MNWGWVTSTGLTGQVPGRQVEGYCILVAFW